LNNDPSPNGYKTTYPVIVVSGWYDHEYYYHDMGIAILKNNSSSCDLGHYGWRTNYADYHSTAYLYGIPGFSFSCTASPRRDHKCWSSIYGMSGQIEYVGTNTFEYRMDAQPGQSGSGIYRISDSSKYVVGVHRGPAGSINQGVKINSSKRDFIDGVHAGYLACSCEYCPCSNIQCEDRECCAGFYCFEPTKRCITMN
jgi:V8-like Glu-specific endopeptidase